MREGMSGSLIYKLDPLAPASKSLCLNDVVLAIEDVAIADDSTIEFREEERVEFTYHVRNKHVGALSGYQRPAMSNARSWCSAYHAFLHDGEIIRQIYYLLLHMS